MSLNTSQELISKFENLLTLKTMMDLIDLNYISIDDLEEIILYTDELDISLENKELLYSDYTTLEIYKLLFNDINNMYLETKNKIIKKIDK